MSARLTALIAISLLGSPALAATPVMGRWLTAAKESVVDIQPCGGQVCGRIARLLKPVAGGPPTDRNNPDVSLRSRPVVGLPILTGFTDRGSTWGGTIYDPRVGKSYRSFLTRNPDGTLKVQGCVAFFCHTETWSPAP